MIAAPAPPPSSALQPHPPAQELVRRWLDGAGAVLHDGRKLQAEEASARIKMPASAGESGLSAPLVNVLRILRSALEGTQEFLAGGGALAGPSPELQAGCGIWVTSSGSTGRPKGVYWRWAELLKAHPLEPGPQRTSVMSYYPLPYFSGLQGVLHGLLHGRELSLVDGSQTVEKTVSASDPVNALHILGTPSQMRFALASGWRWPADRVSLVAMGGEPAGQAVLDTIAAVAPLAKITHTYATSEHGSLFCVSDGRAGFPLSLLDRRLRCGKQISVRQGVLTVQDSLGLHPTSDRVERAGDRMVFAGRSDRCASVAGQVVDLAGVELALTGDAEVNAVHAQARESSVTGAVIMVHVEPVAGADRIALERRLRERAEANLSYVARPRRYAFHDLLPVAPSGKSGVGDGG